MEHIVFFREIVYIQASAYVVDVSTDNGMF